MNSLIFLRSCKRFLSTLTTLTLLLALTACGVDSSNPKDSIIKDTCQLSAEGCDLNETPNVDPDQTSDVEPGESPVDISDLLSADHITAVCASEGAQCGVVRDDLGNSFSCGSCGDGSSCSNNRCESSCGLTQIDNGPMNDLFAYVPTQFAYEDLSNNQLTVETQLLPHEEKGTFVFESSVDMTDKKLTVQLADKELSYPFTLSFKTMPTELDQTGTLLASSAITIKESAGKLVSQFATQNDAITINNTRSQFTNRSCNHVAVTVTENNIDTFFNGKKSTAAVNASQLKTLAGSLDIGPYPGKVWDLRIFEKALSESDVTELGEECNDDKKYDTANAEYPNYLCGVYQCMLWPEGITDTTQESLEYQLSGHDMTWEHNVLDTGMYVQGKLCEEYAKPRALELSEGYRKSWVSKFNFENPWNQYVLHENFHAYQSRTGGSTKWLAESTASWGAFSMKPTAKDSLLGMYTLQPQLALWTTQSSVFEEGIIDESKGGHQYGASIFHYYITHYILADNAIGKVFNRSRQSLAPLSGAPAEAMYTLVQEAGFDMRDVFTDFAARITTWDIDYGDTFLASEIASFNRMNGNNKKSETPVPDEEVDNKIAEFYDVSGTKGQWLAVPSRYKVGAWAFNAYEVDVTENTTYNLAMKPSTQNPDYAEFRAQVVVYNETTGERRYSKLPATSAGIATNINVYAEAGEKMYLVVTSTPTTVFTGFEAFTYDYKIEAL